MELSVPANAPLREHGDGYLVLLNELNAFADGLQGLPVIFPVYQLAHQLVHHRAHEGHRVVFLFGNKGQLAVGKTFENHAGVNLVEMVAHQQEPALGGRFFQALGVNVKSAQSRHQINIQVRKAAVEGAVVELLLFPVHRRAGRR